METEIDNLPSLKIYEKLGFIRTKRLHRYYLNGNTAFRLVLYLKPGIPYRETYPTDYYGDGGGGMDGNGGAGGEYGSGEIGSGGGTMPAGREQDLIERQAAQMRIEDEFGERHDVRGI